MSNTDSNTEWDDLIAKYITRESHKGSANRIRIQMKAELQRLAYREALKALPEKGTVNWGGTYITTTYASYKDAVQHGYNQAIDDVTKALAEKFNIKEQE